MFYGIRIGSLGLPGYGGGGAEPEADVIRVRRSSDSTEADYTLTEWDDGTLDTFVGAGDGCLAEWYDYSGNDNHVVQSTTTLQPKVAISGTVQEGVVFDGVDDALTLGTRLTSGAVTELTVAAFVKFTSTASMCFVGEYHSAVTKRMWMLGAITGYPGKLCARVSADGGFTNFKSYHSTSAINDNNWHHVAMTFSSGVLKIFIDGVEDTTPTKAFDGLVASIYNSDAPLLIGANSDTGFYFPGASSHVGVWDSALTAGNIATLATGESVGSPLIFLKGNYSP